MHARWWNDYVCPWAYLGRDRAALMQDLGVTLTQLPYELHPEIPPDGRAVRPGGRLSMVFAHIGNECDELGIPFRPPTRIPNTRQVLQLTEIIRLHAPGSFTAVDEAIARAQWVDGLDIGDRDLIHGIIDDAGAPTEKIYDLFADGVGADALAASIAEARDLGVTATPAWWVDDRLLIPGAQPRETITRWITRLQVRPV